MTLYRQEIFDFRRLLIGLSFICLWLVPTVMLSRQLGSSLLPSSIASSSYRFDHWRTDDGLPDNTVNALLQTSDGYLWLGTQRGLARFDGIRFTTLTQATPP